MVKRLCIVTGSRAEYGLLKNIIIKMRECFDLKLVVCGSHFSNIHGNSVELIKNDKIKIDYEIKTIEVKYDSKNIITSIANEMTELAIYFSENKFDYIIVLGDRYEIMAVAFVATIYQIKIIHFCGGDITNGSYDNEFRNSITQMSHIHFVSCLEAKKRVEMMGKKDVYVVGNPGLEIFRNFNCGEKKHGNYIMFVYHVETKNIDKLEGYLCEIELFFDYLHNNNIKIICIGTNMDNNNDLIRKLYVKKKYLVIYDNLEREEYLRLAYHSDLFMGNSSSGIYEIPYFNKYVINIGVRQEGRREINSVINCDCEFEILKNAYESYSKKKIISNNLFPIINTSERICEIIEKY